MKDKEFDFLMAFKKYRNLKENHKRALKDNRILRKNWEQQIIINDNLKDKIKAKNRIIKEFKNKINELERSKKDDSRRRKQVK